MKVNNIRKEIPFVLLFLISWIVYATLRKQLPDQVPSHFTIDDGKWVADRYSSPGSLMLGLSVAAIIVYFAMSFPVLLKGANPEMSPGMKRWLYYFKLALVTFIFLIPVYTLLAAANKLPDVSDGNLANVVMLLLLVMMNGFLYVLFSRVNRNLPQPVSEKYYMILWIGTHVVVSAAPLVVILSSQGIQAGRMVPQLVLLFIAICGNLLYSARPNRYMGIRTPWTLRNEEVWRKTHRVSGVWSFVAGLTGFIICVFAPEEILPVVVFAVAIVVGGVGVAYSYWLYRKIVPQRYK